MQVGTHGVYVDALINKCVNTRAFIDLGCLCYATVSERYANTVKLTTFAIPTREL